MLPIVDNWYFQLGVLLLLTGVIAWLLFTANTTIQHYWRGSASLVDLINLELPQTQCGQCGHAGCLPYARAISQGEAINKCPPGGITTIHRLARLLNEVDQTVDPAHGRPASPKLAFIREAECIGCTKCIQACPVDAILGAPKLMHTVIARECTGCDLCVAPCPVDCIDIIDAPTPVAYWSQAC